MALDERLRHELERAARPADPSGVYEHMIRRKERRRIARKLQSGVLAVAVVTGSIAGAYGLSRVFRVGFPPPEPVAPGGTSVVPSPSLTESPLPDGAEDIGLGFPVCLAERLGRIDYLGDGTDGNAWTAVPLTDDGTCPEYPAPGGFLLAVDHTGDRFADSWIDLAFECENLCAPFDATDLDGNGTEELIVARYFSIVDYYVFAVRPNANGTLRVEPILVAAPGHRPAQISAGEPLRIDAGGDAGYGSSIECEGYPSAPVIVWSWSYAEIDSDEPTEVHVTRIELQPDGFFHVIDTNDYTVPAGTPSGIAYAYELESECGVDWWR